MPSPDSSPHVSKMITGNILVDRPGTAYRQTIDSLNIAGIPAIIGDYNSGENFNQHTIKLSGNRAEARNTLASATPEGWIIQVEPGEMVCSGWELLFNLNGSNRKKVYILQDDMIVKEDRIWLNGTGKFENPVCETLSVSDDPQYLDVFIAGTSNPININCLLEWKKQSPHRCDIDYYLACEYLQNKQIDQFFKHANSYLFAETKAEDQILLMKYYLGLVYLQYKKDVHQAIRYLTSCLAARPLMAEFWCGLADCYYRAGDMDRAKELYRNAIIMGVDRQPNDNLPVHLSKYSDYPTKMIELCNELQASAKTTLSGH